MIPSYNAQTGTTDIGLIREAIASDSHPLISMDVRDVQRLLDVVEAAAEAICSPWDDVGESLARADRLCDMLDRVGL